MARYLNFFNGSLFLFPPLPQLPPNLAPRPRPRPRTLPLENGTNAAPSFLRAGGRCYSSRHLRHQIFWNVFHVGLYQRGAQRLVMLQEFEIIKVVLKASLQATPIR